MAIALALAALHVIEFQILCPAAPRTPASQTLQRPFARSHGLSLPPQTPARVHQHGEGTGDGRDQAFHSDTRHTAVVPLL